MAKNSQKNIERVYVDVMEDKFDVYHLTQNQPAQILFSIVSLKRKTS